MGTEVLIKAQSPVWLTPKPTLNTGVHAGFLLTISKLYLIDATSIIDPAKEVFWFSLGWFLCFLCFVFFSFGAGHSEVALPPLTYRLSSVLISDHCVHQ